MKEKDLTGTQKKQLRQELLKQRKALSKEVWQAESDRLCQQLKKQRIFQSAKTILAYQSFRKEPDLSPLWEEYPEKKWGLPRCVQKSLHWHQWQPGEVLEKGAYGILEPPGNSPSIEPETVDLILVPTVACNLQGYRLGYGGGYYDRMLALPQWHSKITLGIVFDFALLKTLPLEPWDFPLKGFCTPSKLLIF